MEHFVRGSEAGGQGDDQQQTAWRGGSRIEDHQGHKRRDQGDPQQHPPAQQGWAPGGGLVGGRWKAGRFWKAPGFYRYELDESAEAAIAGREVADRLVQVAFAEFGPQVIGDPDFGVADLPE